MFKSLKKLLIAHPHNDHRPYLLRDTGIIVSLLFIAIIFAASHEIGVWVGKSQLGAAVYPSVITDLTNQSRESNGLGDLAVSPLLERAASLKAADMAEKGYFAHNSPEGYLPWHWFGLVGYSYLYAGENLAINFHDSNDVQNAWMNSPEHRANILNPHYTEIGIALAQGNYQGKETTFIVEMFGSPRAAVVDAVASLPTQAPTSALAVATEIVPPEVPVETSYSTTSTSTLDISTTTAATTATTTIVATASTSTDLSRVEGASTVAAASWFDKLLVEPGKVAAVLYIIFSIAVFISLLSLFFVEMEIEVKRHNGKHIIYAILILALTLVFAYLEWHTALSQIRIV